MKFILTNTKKHICFSYCYELICVDDKFSEAFTLYLDEVAAIEMKAMKDYHNLSLRCDVLLLADFLKKKMLFRKLQIMSKSLFERISLKLVCNA